MKRLFLAALLTVVLTAPAVRAQVRLLPPSEKSNEEVQKVEVITPPVQAKSGVAVIGPPTSLPPPVVTPPPVVPQTGPPHQMQGREPAHGKQTAGVPKGPLPTPPALEPSVIPPPQVCPPCGRAWAEIDYLVWFVEGDHAPALLTSSPNGTPQNLAGILGAPGTSTLIGARRINDDAQSGVRFNLGYWLNPLQTIGVQAGAFWLANHDTSAGFTSTGDPILARPFFNTVTNKQDAEIIAFPGFSTGSVIVTTHTSLDGWDVALRQNATCFCNGRIDGIVGYRQLRLADQLGIVGDSTLVTGSGGMPAGTQILAVDRFDTLNEFYGAEFGFLGEYRLNRFVFEGSAKVAAGWNISHVNINGASFITLPASAPTTSSGGLLALPTNIGLVRYSHPTLIPEFGLNVAYDLTDHWRLRGGYNFLYWDQVRRPGQQIDTGINPNLVPPALGGGPVRPLASRDETDIFVHGMNFGIEVRY